jgi:hypothetical protein
LSLVFVSMFLSDRAGISMNDLAHREKLRPRVSCGFDLDQQAEGRYSARAPGPPQVR